MFVYVRIGSIMIYSYLGRLRESLLGEGIDRVPKTFSGTRWGSITPPVLVPGGKPDDKPDRIGVL